MPPLLVYLSYHIRPGNTNGFIFLIKIRVVCTFIASRLQFCNIFDTMFLSFGEKDLHMIDSVFRVNQAGYSVSLPKYAAVLREGTVSVCDAAGKVIRTVDTGALYYDECTGDRVALIELGDLPAGDYTLELDGVKRGISVSEKPYSALVRGLIKGLYYQRCGTELRPEHAGKWTHGACHTARARLYTDPDVLMDVQGGWHDAGDYGKYVGPGAVTVGHLLYTWLLFPRASLSEMNIPESGNGVPDILNEARYELEWMLKMQFEDGSVSHKLTKTHFAAFIMPEEDKEQEYVMPVGQCATADFAACMALASRIWKQFDPEFSEKMLSAAVRAWDWLEQHPVLIPWKNPDDVRTGGYGDNCMTDELFWAGCELYAATGDEQYVDSIEFHAKQIDISQMGWREVGGLGSMCCLFELNRKLDPDFLDWLRSRFLRAADRAADTVSRSVYGTALGCMEYIWGSNLTVLSRAMTLICGWKLSGEQRYLNGSVKQLDYLLGMNTLDLSFVTGFGTNPYMHPHHRPSGADGIDDPVPGLVSGGPNNRFTYPVTKERLPDVPPAKSYLDETPSADTNEIAIYWNSPAVFVAACLDTI